MVRARQKGEAATATPGTIDTIDITGDTATVTGFLHHPLLTSPPEVVDGTNQAVRENGQWKDCTPPTH